MPSQVSHHKTRKLDKSSSDSSHHKTKGKSISKCTDSKKIHHSSKSHAKSGCKSRSKSVSHTKSGHKSHNKSRSKSVSHTKSGHNRSISRSHHSGSKVAKMASISQLRKKIGCRLTEEFHEQKPSSHSHKSTHSKPSKHSSKESSKKVKKTRKLTPYNIFMQKNNEVIKKWIKEHAGATFATSDGVQKVVTPGERGVLMTIGAYLYKNPGKRGSGFVEK